ncbi:hypothetical protein NBRC103581_00727 [Gluconobacter wancherniae NBRC 103581]|nr:hypothetical protein NBRC103581_00727 [Gluconobacter wancherniae NBRC 103581]
MIEFVVASLIVLCAALYWYARLFPQGWQKVRAGMGLKTSPAVINKSGGCGSCSGCKVGCKSHQ